MLQGLGFEWAPAGLDVPTFAGPHHNGASPILYQLDPVMLHCRQLDSEYHEAPS